MICISWEKYITLKFISSVACTFFFHVDLANVPTCCLSDGFRLKPTTTAPVHVWEVKLLIIKGFYDGSCHKFHYIVFDKWDYGIAMGRGGGPTNGANSFSAQLHSSCALSPAALSFPLIDVCSEKNKHPGVLWLLQEAKINRTPWKKITRANYMMT